ncbi:MAG: RNA polymerase sigma factor [Flavobacteriaceae bacterium]|nr:RNA polymerase sigma factor [Flavobacteriaceae bacterium]
MKIINLYQDEKEFIRLAVAQNRQAQQQIYLKYSAKMLSVCRQYIKDIHEAEDVLLMAFLKVFTHLKSYEHAGSFEGWIRKIIINECISFIRSKKKITYLDDEFYMEEPLIATESELSTDEIQLLIDGLPDGYRMVFNLYVMDGYKHQEIASMLGIAEGTSKSQLSHARKLLQERIINSKKYSYELE